MLGDVVPTCCVRLYGPLVMFHFGNTQKTNTSNSIDPSRKLNKRTYSCQSLYVNFIERITTYYSPEPQFTSGHESNETRVTLAFSCAGFHRRAALQVLVMTDRPPTLSIHWTFVPVKLSQFSFSFLGSFFRMSQFWELISPFVPGKRYDSHVTLLGSQCCDCAQ